MSPSDDKGFRKIFSNGFMEAPSLNDDEAEPHNSSTIEDNDSSGWSTSTLTEIRQALFGSTVLSRGIISDDTLATFVFSTAGAIGENGLDRGHSWSPSEAHKATAVELEEAGIDIEESDSINWWVTGLDVNECDAF
jgi:hypothetical protein